MAAKSIVRRLDESSIPLPVLLRVFLGGYFIYTGYSKVLDPFVFLKGVHLYDMLPEVPPHFLNGTAIVLPWLEIICGTVLVLGLFTRGAGVLIAGMICVFTPAIFLRALSIMHEEAISFFQVAFDCGCGTGTEIIWIKLCKNTGLLLLALVVIISRSRRFSLTMLLDRLRATARYCRRCGYPVLGSVGGLCEGCSESPAIPTDAV